MDAARESRHEVSLFFSCYGSWATCDCGWHSKAWTAPAGAQWEWAGHLSDVVRKRLTAGA